MSDFTIINSNSSLEELLTQRKDLQGYIRWAKKQLEKHLQTGKPITTRNKGVVTTFGYFELEKDLGDANLELFALERIIRIKRRTK